MFDHVEFEDTQKMRKKTQISDRKERMALDQIPLTEGLRFFFFVERDDSWHQKRRNRMCQRHSPPILWTIRALELDGSVQIQKMDDTI